MAFILQYTVFLIFSFSMLGTELMDAVSQHIYVFNPYVNYTLLHRIPQSSLISEAIYNTKWYEWAAPERRLLLFMLMRSDRVVAISAAKFFHLNRATFGVVLRNDNNYTGDGLIGDDYFTGHEDSVFLLYSDAAVYRGRSRPRSLMRGCFLFLQWSLMLLVSYDRKLSIQPTCKW